MGCIPRSCYGLYFSKRLNGLRVLIPEDKLWLFLNWNLILRDILKWIEVFLYLHEA